jgi:hypothetical protein
MKLNDKGIQLKKIVAIGALGLAGFAGVAACTTAASPAPQPLAPSQPTTTTSQPTTTTTTQPPATTAQPGPTPAQVAKYVANVAVGNGPLNALESSDGEAASADCDPSTVSNPPDVSTPTSASCDITYLDGSVWEQTVTITFDNNGDAVAASTNVGTELSQPTGG